MAIALDILFKIFPKQPIPVTAWSKAWVCDCLFAETAGSNPTEDMDVCLL
jgi:hypothetical protein